MRKKGCMLGRMKEQTEGTKATLLRSMTVGRRIKRTHGFGLGLKGKRKGNRRKYQTNDNFKLYSDERRASSK